MPGRPRRWLTDSKLLFLARPRKSNQKEGRPKTRCDLQSQSPRIKRKIGAARTRAMLRIIRPQTTLAMILFLF